MYDRLIFDHTHNLSSRSLSRIRTTGDRKEELSKGGRDSGAKGSFWLYLVRVRIFSILVSAVTGSFGCFFRVWLTNADECVCGVLT